VGGPLADLGEVSRSWKSLLEIDDTKSYANREPNTRSINEHRNQCNPANTSEVTPQKVLMKPEGGGSACRLWGRFPDDGKCSCSEIEPNEVSIVSSQSEEAFLK